MRILAAIALIASAAPSLAATPTTGASHGRLEVGVTIAGGSQVILLDEPSNHLDLPAHEAAQMMRHAAEASFLPAEARARALAAMQKWDASHPA